MTFCSMLTSPLHRMSRSTHWLCVFGNVFDGTRVQS